MIAADNNTTLTDVQSIIAAKGPLSVCAELLLFAKRSDDAICWQYIDGKLPEASCKLGDLNLI